MKNLSVILLFVAAFYFKNISGQPTVDELKALIASAHVIEDSFTWSYGLSRFVPNTAIAKGSKKIPRYPGGVYEFVVRPFKEKNVYRFDLLNFPKSCLLSLVIVGDAGGCQFILPHHDTIIHGKNIAGTQFIVGQGACDEESKNYYFITEEREYSHKITIKKKNSAAIFATNPASFSLDDNAEKFEIFRLYKNNNHQFFFEHTLGLTEFPQAKSMLKKTAIIPEVHHSRPAKNHQLYQILEYIIAVEQGARYLTFAATTGSGKTNTMIRLAEIIKPKKVLIVTPRENLITQITEESRLHYKGLRIAASNQVHHNLSSFLTSHIDTHDVLVTSIQGFQNPTVYENEAIMSKIDVVVFDEAHNLLSSNRLRAINYLKEHYKSINLLFFTATPISLYPHQQSGLLSVYELSGESAGKNHITPYTLFDAIDDKINVPFQIIHVSNLPHAGEFTLVNNEYSEQQVSSLLAQDKELHSIVLDINENGNVARPEKAFSRVFGKFAILFCVSILHAEHMKQFFNKQINSFDDEQKQILSQLEHEYERNVRQHFVAKGFRNKRALHDDIQDFLGQNPFVFADVVHSGNDEFKLAKQEVTNRLLRNKLGGSLLMCGASQLIEGYDNPRIEVVFMLRPVRRSNNFLLQALGRALRVYQKNIIENDEVIGSENVDKMALFFQFIWDEKQLLLSSSDVLNTMNYGASAQVSVKQHRAGIKDYHLSHDLIMRGEARTKKSKKHARNDNHSSDTPHRQKSKKVKTQLPADALAEQLFDLVKRLEKKLRLLTQFSIERPTLKDGEEDDFFDQDIGLSSSSGGSNSSLNSSYRAESSLDSVEVVHEVDRLSYEISLFLKTPKAPLNNLTTTNQGVNEQFVQLPGLINQAEVLAALLKRARNILNKAEQFIVGSQVLPASDTLSVELTALEKQYEELFDFDGREKQAQFTHNDQYLKSALSSGFAAVPQTLEKKQRDRARGRRNKQAVNWCVSYYQTHYIRDDFSFVVMEYIMNMAMQNYRHKTTQVSKALFKRVLKRLRTQWITQHGEKEVMAFLASMSESFPEHLRPYLFSIKFKKDDGPDIKRLASMRVDYLPKVIPTLIQAEFKFWPDITRCFFEENIWHKLWPKNQAKGKLYETCYAEFMDALTDALVGKYGRVVMYTKITENDKKWLSSGKMFQAVFKDIVARFEDVSLENHVATEPDQPINANFSAWPGGENFEAPNLNSEHFHHN